MIENFTEITEYFEKNKDVEEVKGYIKGFNNIVNVKSFLESNEEGKGYLQTYTDAKVTKAIKTHTETTLPGLVQAEVLKLNPNKDEKDIKLEKVMAELETIKKDSLRKDIKSQIITELTSKKLPIEMVDLLVNDDIAISKSNIALLEKVFTSSIDAGVVSRLGAGAKPIVIKDFDTTTNPYNKATYSLTLQMELEQNQPILAKQLRESAK